MQERAVSCTFVPRTARIDAVVYTAAAHSCCSSQQTHTCHLGVAEQRCFLLFERGSGALACHRDHRSYLRAIDHCPQLPLAAAEQHTQILKLTARFLCFLVLQASLFVATAVVLLRTTLVIGRGSSSQSWSSDASPRSAQKRVSFCDDVEIQHLPSVYDYEPVLSLCTTAAERRKEELRELIEAMVKSNR